MELFRALAALVERPGDNLRPVAGALELGDLPGADEHHALFGQLPPYASIYLGGEGMIGGEARDRIAGFWRAIGETPPPEPDHLSVMLAFHARLGDLESEVRAGPAREALSRTRFAWFTEHLECWLPLYLAKIVEIGPGFYRRWAALLAAAVREESGATPARNAVPLHLREAPGPAALPTEGTDAFLAWLLTPVRTGFILTRPDLSQAARTLGLGLRLRDRREALRALLVSDAAPALRWLAGEADRWAARGDIWTDAALAARWTGCAARSAALLRAGADEIAGRPERCPA